MNAKIIKYVLGSVVFVTTAVTSFSVVTDKLGYGKVKNKVVTDIPESEVEPDIEEYFEEVK